MRTPLYVACLAATLAAVFTAAAQTPTPAPKVVELDAHGHDYRPVLNGPPETAGMRSGLVVLAPQKSVGRHSTGQNEEVLIVLEGKGEMLFSGRSFVAGAGQSRRLLSSSHGARREEHRPG